MNTPLRQYMRDIVGRAVRVRTYVDKPKVTKHRFSVIVQESRRVRTDFGWRLSCGHVIDGQKGHGKQRFGCYYCEWIADGQFAHLADQSKDNWTDISADEAERLQAQS